MFVTYTIDNRILVVWDERNVPTLYISIHDHQGINQAVNHILHQSLKSSISYLALRSEVQSLFGHSSIAVARADSFKKSPRVEITVRLGPSTP